MTCNPDPRSRRRIAAPLIALAALLLAGAPAAADRDLAQDQLAQARRLLAEGNATGARAWAFKAIRAAPDWAEAHVEMARARLALDEGLEAEGEIERAVAAGADPRALAAMRARAILLQGDARAAIKAAADAPAADRVAALRVQGLARMRLGDLAGARDLLEQAVAAAQRDAGAWTDLGRFRYVAGDMLGAYAAAERAVALNPKSVPALVLRGELVRQRVGLIAAMPWFRAAIERDPYHHDALIELAATLGDTGQTIDMLQMTRRAAAARPGSVRALYLQAVLAARAGNYGLARGIVDRGGDAMAAIPGGLLLSATLDLQAGGNEQALGKLGRLIDAQPMNLTVRRLFATALLRVDAARNARTALAPMIARPDADSYALELSARALERLGDRAGAGMLLDRAAWPGRTAIPVFASDEPLVTLASRAAAAPSRPDLAIPLIRALIVAGRGGEALARAERVAADNPGAPGGAVLVGDVQMALDRPGQAATAYRRAAAIRFDQQTLLRLIEALDASGDATGATTALAAFLAQNPANAIAQRLVGMRQLAAGDAGGAIATLELVRFRLGDRDAALLAALSQAYAANGDADAALRFGEAAHALQPANPLAADAHGAALLGAGNARAAAQLLAQAVATAPGHAGLRWHLAQALAASGDRAGAAAMLRTLIADPGFGETSAANALLARLG